MNINITNINLLKNAQRVGEILILLLVIFSSCSRRTTNIESSYKVVPSYTGQTVTLNTKQKAEKERLLIKAKKESSFSNLNAARESYIKILNIDPNCDVCYYEMAMLYYRAGYLINASKFSHIAYEIDSTNTWYKRQYANLSAMRGNHAEAEKLFSSLMNENPQNPELYYALASVYENMRQYDKAITLYDSAQNRFGFNVEVSIRKQEIFSNMGDIKKRIEEAKTLIKYDPENARFYGLLGDAYAQELNDSLTIHSYNIALAIDSTFSPAILGKAEIARKNGDFNEYFRNLELYCKSDNKIDDLDKVEYLSLVLRIPTFSEYFKTNIDQIFNILNDIYPESFEVKQLHSSFLMQTGRPDSAIEILNNLIKIDSSNYNVWSLMLSMKYSLMRWNDLKADAERAISIFPKRAHIYMYRGVAYWQLNQLDNATIDFEHAVKIDDNENEDFTTQLYAFLGDLYHQMGKDKKSFENYEKALEIDSINATVLNNYAYNLAIKGLNIKKAYIMSKKALEIEPSNPSFLDTFGWILFLQGKLTESRTIFRQALAAGGKDSAVLLDHYADVLYALGEYDTASIYWNQALDKPDLENKEEIEKKLLKLKNK